MKEKTKTPDGITFSIDQLRGLPDEALGELIIERFEKLRYPFPKEAKVDKYRTTTPMRQLCEWFMKLPPATFATFFAATTWPPPKVKEEKPEAKPKPNASKPRAKRSKTKEELAELRKSKPSKPRAKANGDYIPTKSEESFAAKMRSKSLDKPRLATGDELAADSDARDELMAYMKGKTNVTAAEITAFCNFTAGQTKGLLKRLREQGAITVFGKNRGARYSLASSNSKKGKDEEE
jgi:hypothetical protein